MLEKIDFSKDYGEIFADAKKKAFYVLKNPLDDEIIFKAQAGDKEFLDKVYLYYEPVIEYLYLKHSPMYDNDYEKQELASVFQYALVRSINSYRRQFGKTFYQYLTSCACTDEMYSMKKLKSNQQDRNGIEESCNIESFASLDEKNDVNRSVLAEKLIIFLTDAEKDIVLSILSGESVKQYAERVGSCPESINSKLAYAKKKILKKYLKCKSVAEAFYTDKKSVRQIAEDDNISRVEVHYWLRLYDYLYNEGKYPEMPEDPIVYERTKIAECLLCGYNLRLYKKLSASVGNDFKRVVGRSIEKYKDAFYLIETARQNMRIVCDWNDQALTSQVSKPAFIKFDNQEQEFYMALYKYVIVGEGMPIYTEALAKKLEEQSKKNIVFIEIL